MQIDKTVKKETLYIFVNVLIMSVIMELVFLAIGKWDLTVLYGNLLGGIFSILNFFLMGLTVQKAIGKDANNSKNLVKISQNLRYLLLIIIAVIGVKISIFNPTTTIISLFFPRIAIAIRPLIDKKGRSSLSKKRSDDI